MIIKIHGTVEGYSPKDAGEILKKAGIKFKHKKPPSQDVRVLRRYPRRWKIERLFVWLQNYRRALVRNGYHLDNFLGMVHLTCILIMMRRY